MIFLNWTELNTNTAAIFDKEILFFYKSEYIKNVTIIPAPSAHK